MDLQLIILIALAALVFLVAVLQVVLLFKKPKKEEPAHNPLDEINGALSEIERFLGFLQNENKTLRDEMSARIDRLKDAQASTILELKDAQSGSMQRLAQSTNTDFNDFRQKLDERLDRLGQANNAGFNNVRDKLDERLDKLGEGIRISVTNLQESNEKKLDQMQAVVNEKLDKTLESRLKMSFETVSNQLESVNKGLGEMRTVAESVGSLNKVLGASKTRGILGELQLSHIIEDMFAPHLYEREFTIPGKTSRVEFAIKLPGTDDGGHVHLPIDSKFPLDDYYRLLDGYDAGDMPLVEESRKALIARIKTFAKEVTEKYISPPATTNFAVIFLPTEGLYAELARDAGFFDALRKTGIIIAGPTTLSALLSSLQIGFNTLQIQKGAADIEKTLGFVKKEFETFETALTKVQDRITKAGTEIETLVGTRTRAINRRLKDVQTYNLISEDE